VFLSPQVRYDYADLPVAHLFRQSILQWLQTLHPQSPARFFNLPPMTLENPFGLKIDLTALQQIRD